MDVAGNERRFGYGALGAGAIQVEFGRVPDTDLEEFSEVPGGDWLPAWGAPAPHPPGPPYPPAAGPMKSKNIGPANPELDDAVFDNDTDLEHDDTVLDSDTDLGAGGDGH
jgi:hypothetical protein